MVYLVTSNPGIWLSQGRPQSIADGFFLSKKMNLSLLIPALNHVLAQESWASRQLQLHAGKTACIDLSMFSIRFRVTGQGFLEPAPDEMPVSVTIRINPADLPLILRDKQRAVSYVKLEGDADLAQTISELGLNLRWDAEQELSRVVGDIPARRMAMAGKSLFSSLQRSGQKLQENIAEYFLDENPQLVRPVRVSEFAREVARTRDDVERLMKRIEKCEKARQTHV